MDKATAVTNMLNKFSKESAILPAVKKLSINPPSEVEILKHDMNNYRNLNIALN